MKYASPSPGSSPESVKKSRPSGGFALVVALMMMILLVVVGVGLLSLATISLRTSQQGSAEAEARANARLGLMMAIGQLQQIGIMNRVGIESSKITALNNYPDLSGDQIRKGATSLLTMDVLHGQGTARQVFHDYAPRSLSLLTDTRLGGFARDLSTAFELTNADYNAIAEFHGSGEKNTSEGYTALGGPYNDAKFYGPGEPSRIGYLAEIKNGSSIFRGPTWDLLRNHYRLYKRDWDASNSWSRAYSSPGNQSFASRGSLPHSYSKNYTSDGIASPFFYHPGVARFYGRATRGGYKDINYLDKARNGFDLSDNGEAMIHARSPRLATRYCRSRLRPGIQGTQGQETGRPLHCLGQLGRQGTSHQTPGRFLEAGGRLRQTRPVGSRLLRRNPVFAGQADRTLHSPRKGWQNPLATFDHCHHSCWNPRAARHDLPQGKWRGRCPLQCF